MCDGVIVSVINSTPLPDRENPSAGTKKINIYKYLCLVSHQEQLFISINASPPPSLLLTQKPLLVINTVVCISRMHLALTRTLKKVISGRMWLTPPL